MNGLDTNILIRFLVKDDEKQALIVYKKFKEAEINKEVLFVPILVVLETIWVLKSVYNKKREEILDCFSDLLLLPVLKFESQPIVRNFVTIAKESKTDLSDILIGQSAKYAGCEKVLTFDKKASENYLFHLL